MTRLPQHPIHPGDGDPRHGTNHGYMRLKCRCDACRKAALPRTAARVKAYRRRQGKPPRTDYLASIAAKCGTRSGHHAHLRRNEKPCDECLRADREYHAARRARKAAS